MKVSGALANYITRVRAKATYKEIAVSYTTELGVTRRGIKRRWISEVLRIISGSRALELS